jgi:hypothetical protein
MPSAINRFISRPTSTGETVDTSKNTGDDGSGVPGVADAGQRCAASH